MIELLEVLRELPILVKAAINGSLNPGGRPAGFRRRPGEGL